jgi:hypothetical protein
VRARVVDGVEHWLTGLAADRVEQRARTQLVSSPTDRVGLADVGVGVPPDNRFSQATAQVLERLFDLGAAALLAEAGESCTRSPQNARGAGTRWPAPRVIRLSFGLRQRRRR